ncbi:MAG: hypothetical protein H6667_11835 [Ardenticatenaceae bacterium]|nr:hypothetical protein [Ardenticatenaceae bacterium]
MKNFAKIAQAMPNIDYVAGHCAGLPLLALYDRWQQYLAMLEGNHQAGLILRLLT